MVELRLDVFWQARPLGLNESIKGKRSEKMHEKPAEHGKAPSFKGLVFLLTVNQGRRG
jgi:hypothetical protein